MRTFSLLLTAMMMLPMLAQADACQMTTRTAEVDTNTGIPGAPRYYLDKDNCSAGQCIFSIWGYEESNGIDGLQRADEVADDTCGGAAGPGDTIIVF